MATTVSIVSNELTSLVKCRYLLTCVNFLIRVLSVKLLVVFGWYVEHTSLRRCSCRDHRAVVAVTLRDSVRLLMRLFRILAGLGLQVTLSSVAFYDFLILFR